MGRYLRKFAELGEGTVTEKTAEMEAVGRKRKGCLRESELSTSSVQLKTRRLATVVENSALPANSGNSSCETIGVGPDNALTSCCSSNGSSEVTKGTSNFIDLEDPVEFLETSAGDSLDCRERRETTPLREARAESDELDSMTRPRESNTAEKMPSEAELEEFFAAAEKDIHKKFIDKYNYDIVKDQPLEGRYEWVQVQLKP